jgi:CheY-like chemotaxis protein
VTVRAAPPLLVVDDEVLVAMTLAAELRQRGATVFEAFAPAEALRLLDEHPEIEALITDVRMPEMSGPDLARKARATRPRLAVVFCTGYSDERDAAAFNGWPVLAKPFAVDSLVPMLNRALARRDARG